jgi:hypothetical protein
LKAIYIRRAEEYCGIFFYVVGGHG